MNGDVIDLLNYIPKTIICNIGRGQEVDLNCWYDSELIHLSYIVKQGNNANREHSFTLSRFISKSKETFEVLGLLQAEAGKTNNGCVNFTNSEPKIINKVINWFSKEFKFTGDTWKWYIKINVNEPKSLEYKKYVECKCLEYWLKKSKIDKEQSYPKKVTYITKTENKELSISDYGTLIMEKKMYLFSLIFKKFLKEINKTIVNEDKSLIRSYIKGIIAGESCIERDVKSMKFRVHISTKDQIEKEIYVRALGLLEINAYNYPSDKIVISKRENLVKLLRQRLMTLHPRKYAKFLNMMKKYPEISEETGYFLGNKGVWNKIPEEKIREILKLYNSGTIRTEEIAEKIGISQIKVQRVLKENNLGKRKNNYSEQKRKEIVIFAKDNPNLRQYEIAQYLDVPNAVVSRAIAKFK